MRLLSLPADNPDEIEQHFHFLAELLLHSYDGIYFIGEFPQILIIARKSLQVSNTLRLTHYFSDFNDIPFHFGKNLFKRIFLFVGIVGVKIIAVKFEVRFDSLIEVL